MLSRLSRTASRILDITWTDLDDFDDDAISYDDEEFSFQHALSELSLHVPEAPLENVVDYCGKILNPLCKYVGYTLSSDFESVVRTMQEADREPNPSSQEVDDDDDEPIYLIPPDPPRPPIVDTRSSTSHTSSQKVANSNSSSITSRHTPLPVTPPSPQYPQVTVPTIVITPASSSPREVSSLVPIQNAAFGSRLTVPSHCSFNAAFPPMARPPMTPACPAVQRWTYENGHWCANVPKLCDQERMGVFSRPLGLRRRLTLCGRKRLGKHRAPGR